MMEDKRNEQRKQWWASHPGLEKKPSMKRRKAGHDYYGRCIYMITLVVEGRRQVLGQLCDSDAAHPLPWLQPSPLGHAVLDTWAAIGTHYPQVRSLGIQLMPDHLHGILFVTERMPQHLGRVVEAFKRFCDKARIALGEPRHESRLWELGFNDTILQREGQLDNMLRYLQQNPYRLWTKRNHPDFFTVQHDVDIMGQTVSVMGNRFLLDHPDRVMVQCSRRLTEQQIAQAVEHFVSLSGDGVVLVSACISPGEKAVMRAAFECGARQIILVENGFSPHWKPSGAQFDACARGQILLVAPWPHHNERVSITREQCLQLNALASAISQCD